jgi:DNA-binding transcriptional LysR family regulator
MNSSRYDLVSLRLFVAVVDAGSLTAGAKAFSLSLPAVSKRISELEASVGVRLLDRSKRGIVPSAAGHTLYRHAVQVNVEVGQLSLAMSDHRRGIQAHIRVWANTSAVTGFVPEFLSGFLATRPEVAIDLEESNTEPLIRAVESGAADLGIFAANVSSGSLQTAVCDVDNLVIIAPNAHPLARRRQVSFKETLAYDFVGPSRESALMRQMTAATAQLGQDIRMRVQVRSFDAICQMVARGLGLALLPQSVAHSHSKSMPLTLIPLRDRWAARRTLLVGWREDASLSPPALEFRNQLRQRVRASLTIGKV